MAVALSTTFHAKILGWLKGNAFPAAPSGLKIGLMTSAPNADGTGLYEPNNAHGYTRQALSFGDIEIDAQTSSIKIVTPVVFGPVTTSSWGTLTHAAIFTNDGEMVAYGPLPASRVAPVGDAISFGANAVQIRLK